MNIRNLLRIAGAVLEGWDALTYANVPGGHWLLPAGLCLFAASFVSLD